LEGVGSGRQIDIWQYVRENRMYQCFHLCWLYSILSAMDFSKLFVTMKSAACFESHDKLDSTAGSLKIGAGRYWFVLHRPLIDLKNTYVQ